MSEKNEQTVYTIVNDPEYWGVGSIADGKRCAEYAKGRIAEYCARRGYDNIKIAIVSDHLSWGNRSQGDWDITAELDEVLETEFGAWAEAATASPLEVDELLEAVTLRSASGDFSWMLEDLDGEVVRKILSGDLDEFIKAQIEMHPHLPSSISLDEAFEYYKTLTEYDNVLYYLTRQRNEHEGETSDNSADTKPLPGVLRSILLTLIAIALTVAIVSIPV